jgi:hypothetical protein
MLETVKQTQWHYTKKRASRILLKAATRNIVLAALLSFALFMLPYVLIYIDYYKLPSRAELDTRNWVGLPLLTCLSAGLFGSYFSRLHYIQKYSATLSCNELLSAKDIPAIIVRGSVGVCGAALLYFFLHSEIVTGALIPDFRKASVEFILDAPQHAWLLTANKDLALLVVWGFFAGFSERLLPSILTTTEGKLITKAGDDQEKK